VSGDLRDRHDRTVSTRLCSLVDIGRIRSDLRDHFEKCLARG